jgi:hypothetical protein
MTALSSINRTVDFGSLGPVLRSAVEGRFFHCPYVLHLAALLTILFGAVFLWQLWRSTSRAFGDNRLAVAAITVPLKWIYVIGPIGTFQFILTGIAELGRVQWPAGGSMRDAPSH